MLAGLAAAGTTELFCLTDARSERAEPALEGLGRVVTAPRVERSAKQWAGDWIRGGQPRRMLSIDWREAHRELGAWAPEVDLVWYSHIDSWAAVSDLYPDTPSIVDFDNLENLLLRLRRRTAPRMDATSGVLGAASEVARWAMSRSFDLVDERRWTEVQRHCSNDVDRVVVCSPLDVQRSGLDNAVVVPNGAGANPSADPDRTRLRGGEPTMTFVGALDYEPNTDAVEWFVSSVYPLIRARVPDVQFRVVGRGAEHVSVDKRTPGLVFTGPVEDLDAELALTDVSVVPIRLGAGTRLKVIEAMAGHLPLVTTTVGCEGIDLMHRDEALIADDPRRFADACLRLMSEGALRQRLADNAAALFERRYRWESIEESVGELATEIARAAG